MDRPGREQFGGELRRLREQTGLSLGELAKLAHVHRGYVGHIECIDIGDIGASGFRCPRPTGENAGRAGCGTPPAVGCASHAAGPGPAE
ncbi:MAG TPA: helix-turn-helix transcriptional regulator [Pseudonocardiaceae bacterium]|nr:helix-turn-helix transcriptional regulator [Pseudonocardiaceae bacterium]